MGARTVLPLILCLGLVGCGGCTLLAVPTSQAAIASVSPALTLTPTATATLLPPTPKPTPTPRPTPKPVPAPPKPTGVRFDTKAVERSRGRYADITQTVTWRSPRSEGVVIRVYGVTECIAQPENPAPGTGGPCLVIGTPLPASVRTLLGKAPASDGKVSWSWTEETGCDVGLLYDPDGPAYHAIVLAAYNASGHSIFAIAEPGGWYEPTSNEVIC